MPGNAKGAGNPGTWGGWQIALMHGRSWSHLHFGDGSEPVMDHQIGLVTLGYHFAKGIGLGVGLGGVHSGTLRGDGMDLELDPGWLVTARFSWQALAEKGARPFVVLSVSLGVTGSGIARSGGSPAGGSVLGTDLRLDLTAGYTIARRLRLYVSPRVFGGPIFILRGGTRNQGRDRFFFQVGLGAAILLPAGITVFFEGSPGGEQAISGGVALSW